MVVSGVTLLAPYSCLKVGPLGQWKGRICSRPGSHVYNRALVASMIATHGEAKAEVWARGVVKNFARRPQGNDRAQAKAIFQGECDIAIINHYYYGKMLKSEKQAQRDWANAINIVFANGFGCAYPSMISGVYNGRRLNGLTLTNTLLLALTHV